MSSRSEAFMFGNQVPRESVGDGVNRQLLGYDESILMAKVEFEVGGVGPMHSHPHSQVSYVESGEFEVSIDGVKSRLGPGDSFYIGPDLDHGALCLKAGVLIDVFSPVRSDFLAQGDS